MAEQGGAGAREKLPSKTERILPSPGPTPTSTNSVVMLRYTTLLLFAGALLCCGRRPAVATEGNNVLPAFRHLTVDSTRQTWGDWDDPEWLRYFGQDAGDVDGDGDLDLLGGRYLYLNPGGDMSETWRRIVLDDNVDGIFLTDVDGDPLADLIAMALPAVYWYEATDRSATAWTRREVARVPATSHVNSQGFERAQIVPGGPEEFLIAGDGDIYLITIPEDPEAEWSTRLVAANTSDEGIGVGDLDGDGDLDLAAGRRPEGEDEPTILVRYLNPGNGTDTWSHRVIGSSEHPIDRVAVADLNGDGRADIVVTEERYPGEKPDGNLWWFEQPVDPAGEWTRHHVVTQYSMNNLDVADIDGDGDIDLLTNEHKGPRLELQWWLNDGAGNFTKQVIDTRHENHLGTQLADLDGDGDLDIFGGAWDNYRYFHVWRNEGHSTGNSNSPAPRRKKEVTEPAIRRAETTYEDRPHYLVKTPTATYYLDRAGGGLSRLIDTLGNDWIGYRTEPWDRYPASAASAYRGLPNLVFGGKQGGAGHPGHDRMTSALTGENEITSTTTDGAWRWVWTFQEKGATLTVTDTPPEAKYWFLYEGTPGGRWDPGEMLFGTQDGSYAGTEVPDFYRDRSLFQPLRQVWFGDRRLPHVLQLTYHSDAPETGVIGFLGNTDRGVYSPDGMVVMGFGRGPDTEPLLRGPHTFTFGFASRTEVVSSATDE